MKRLPVLIFVLIGIILFSKNVKSIVIFSDEFESGDFSKWTKSTTSGGGTITVSTTRKYSGSYSAFSNTSIGGYPTLFLRFYIKVTASTLANGQRIAIGAIRNLANSVPSGGIRLKDSDLKLNLFYRNGTSWFEATTSTTLSLNQWHSIELKIVNDAVNGEYSVYLDGNEVTDLTKTGLDTNDRELGTVVVGTYGLDQNFLTSNVTYYTDDAVVSNTYIGP